LSAEHSVEDNLAVWKLAQAVGIKKAYLAGRPFGDGDAILRHIDKNSNRAGAMLVAGGSGLGDAEAFAKAANEGEIAVLLSLGSQLETPEAADALGGIGRVIAMATHEGPLAAAARVLLPASSWAEARGTFINAAGLAQVSEKAVASQGESRPAWKLAVEIARLVGTELPV